MNRRVASRPVRTWRRVFVIDERLVKLGPSNVSFDEARHRSFVSECGVE
jgi:hypothetical protein